FSHDQNGVVTSWNRGAARLYGYNPAEAIGRPLRGLDLWQGGGPRGELGDRAEPASFETHARTRSGELVVVSVVTTPLHDEDGRALGELAFVCAITSLKRKEGAGERGN